MQGVKMNGNGYGIIRPINGWVAYAATKDTDIDRIPAAKFDISRTDGNPSLSPRRGIK